jgi:hypothetical protein
VLVGLLLGALAKVADQSPIPGLGDIGTHLGLWIVVLTVTSVSASSRLEAALRCTMLMLGMVAAYYVAAYISFHVAPTLDIAVWGILALTAVPALAVLLWPARAGGWSAVLAVALPVGLLVAETLMFRHVVALHPAPFVFDIVAAATLLWVLPRDGAQRLRAGLLAVPMALLGGWVLSVGFGLSAGLLMRAVV